MGKLYSVVKQTHLVRVGIVVEDRTENGLNIFCNKRVYSFLSFSHTFVFLHSLLTSLPICESLEKISHRCFANAARTGILHLNDLSFVDLQVGRKKSKITVAVLTHHYRY
jgi:hypothetical protein